MRTNDKIAALRHAMKEANVHAYIIPSNDPHMSEYVSEYWQSRKYFSGFTGSAGTLVITQDESGLWTDGRYYIQAEAQISDSEIRLFKMGEKGVPSYMEYLAGHLKKCETVGVDGRLFSANSIKAMKKLFEDKGIGINAGLDFVSEIWTNRPKAPLTEVFLHDKKYTGLDCSEKLEQVRTEMKKNKVNGYVMTELAGIAWLFNIRANDIAYNPMATAYAYITEKEAYLCINQTRMPQEVINFLQTQGVCVKDYEAIEQLLKGIKETSHVLCQEDTINYYLYQLLEQNPVVKIVAGTDIVMAIKAVKNPVEIANIVEAHIKDGCALAQFMVELEEKMASGEEVTEYSIMPMLRDARAAQENNKGESFNAIVAYKENAAMMHYAATEEKYKVLEKEGLLLIDSGGQYLEGTTDITRTFALGPVTEEEKKHYTLVLKSHIALAQGVFLEGCSGANIDILAREVMWKEGLDYKCGTGHGVGFFLGVHEGPHSLRATNHVPFKAGMIVTDEPGVYEEGKHGIRTENILLVKPYKQTPSGSFYHFEVITFFPIDTKPIEKSMLTQEELNWLNDYHQLVYKQLSPRLSGKAVEWLKANTKAI